MDKKNQGKSAFNSVIIIIFFTFGSKLLGFLRETLIAQYFGAASETDAFFVALSATNLLTNLIGTAITTTFIPILFEINAREGQEGRINHTNNLLTISFFISLLLALFTWYEAPLLTKIFAGGFVDEGQIALTTRLIKIGSPKIVFSILAGVFAGYLQSEYKHASSAAQGLPLNFSYIVFLIFLSSRFGITGLMVSAVFGVFLQMFIHLPSLRRQGYKYSFRFELRDQYIRKVILLSGPVFVGTAINDLNSIIDRTLASSLVEGSISALNYANRLKGLVQAVFISSITTVIYPILAKSSSSDDKEAFVKTMNRGLGMILLIAIPATFLLTALAGPIVEVAFKRGLFGDQASRMTSEALFYYSIGLIFMSVRPLLTRGYYSIQDTKTPLINSFLSIIINVALNLLLIGPMEHRGLALATSISIGVSTIWLYFRLEKRVGSLGTKKLVSLLSLLVLASLPMTLVLKLSYGYLAEILGGGFIRGAISLGVSGILGLLTYGGICYLLKIEVFMDLLGELRKKLKFI